MLQSWIIHRKETHQQQMGLRRRLNQLSDLLRDQSLKRRTYQDTDTTKQQILSEMEENRTRAMVNPHLISIQPSKYFRPSLTPKTKISLQHLRNEISEEANRANYLLETLKYRDVTWPEMWLRPESDGGVCSFLGAQDATFDARGTLASLEEEEDNKEHEDGLLLSYKAEVATMVDVRNEGEIYIKVRQRSERTEPERCHDLCQDGEGGEAAFNSKVNAEV